MNSAEPQPIRRAEVTEVSFETVDTITLSTFHTTVITAPTTATTISANFTTNSSSEDASVQTTNTSSFTPTDTSTFSILTINFALTSFSESLPPSSSSSPSLTLSPTPFISQSSSFTSETTADRKYATPVFTTRPTASTSAVSSIPSSDSPGKRDTSSIAIIAAGTAVALLLILALIGCWLLRRRRARLLRVEPFNGRSRADTTSSFGDFVRTIRRTSNATESLSPFSSNGFRELGEGDDSMVSRPSSAIVTLRRTSRTLVVAPTMHWEELYTDTKSPIQHPVASILVQRDGEKSFQPSTSWFGSPPPMYNYSPPPTPYSEHAFDPIVSL
ncbi:hypothetical protein BT96DRAFT_918959 [Gymnopus androsaceus JB14]|uniref:Mid2 domain-containing protein n=1 Tax=Gymnopus androsaceus JB14 TaxID=1447944 RepID=A0A6A4HQA9_9AGAR|nr:hypothetical protein BT96DRAFT_918959 [Gymnopus androsaceus JB14]